MSSRHLFSPSSRGRLPRYALALLLACATPLLAASPGWGALAGGAVVGLAPTGWTAERSYLASPPDVSKLGANDDITAPGPYRYGVEVATPGLFLRDGGASHGQIDSLPDGRQVWRVEVVSPGALSLEFAFARLRLPAGAELFIRSHDGTVTRGPIRAGDVQPDGRYFSAFVPGDSALLEVVAAQADFATADIRVANVAHAYRSIFPSRGTKSGSCNVDTICPLGDQWRDQIDSVGMYTLRVDGSSASCTGTLIANTRGDTTPYFLTANHCLTTETVADTVVAYWNYQSATCRTPGSGASGTPLPLSVATHSQSGSALIATSVATDFTLLRLDAAVPAAANPYWSGWDITGAVPSYSVGIHHPAGDEKRISDSNIPLSTSAYLGAAGSGTAFWRVADWSNGTTEPGSSGSGLWNQNKLLVGNLRGGFAACGNNEPDYYGRLSLSWTGGGTPSTRLRDWLDPINAGVTQRAGNRAASGGGGLDEPTVTRVTLPTPNPPNASCPAGFFIATVADGPGTGLTPGAFGMELLLDEPGTRVLAGGLNFGGLIDVGQVGFAAFNIANPANEAQRVNVSLTGSPSTSSSGSIAVRIRIARRTATTTDVVYESTQTISLASAFTTSIDLPPAFYEATVAPISGTAGGTPEGQFFFSLTTSFVNRPGGGFQGGVVVGGYHATHPFGGVSGFAAFCLATPHTASMRVLSAPSYGASGARDLRLQILDAQQNVVITHPTTGTGGNIAPAANFNVTTNNLTANFSDTSTDSDGSIATRSWNFGDGSTSSATNPSRTYAVAGTYTVTLTVTDNGGASNSTSRAVSVASGGGGASQLSNNVAVSGATNSTVNNSSFADYTVVIPAGASNLSIVTTNATGDLDLHVRFGQAPTLTAYDCRPFAASGNETCTFPSPSAGTWFVRVYGFDTGPQTFTIRASWTVGSANALQNGVAVSGSTSSTSPNSSFAEYTVVIPAGAGNLGIATTNATGDLDLHVRFGQAPTLNTYDCRPFLSSGNESCTFPTPSAGTYFIRVYGFATGPQTFTIRATWNP